MDRLVNKNVLLKICFLLGFLVAISGCRREAKSLTPIPGNEGAIIGGGDPAELLDTYNGVGPGGSLNPGGTLGVNGMLNGGEYLEGNGQSALPRHDLTAGRSEDRETLASYTVYFGYDRSSIQAGELAKVEAVADYLNAESESFVKIEGHCDERGTDEYNRALGERRALSIREVLIRLGISPDRVTTESWGEDRPAVVGETEEAYAKNRRGEFVLLRRSVP